MFVCRRGSGRLSGRSPATIQSARLRLPAVGNHLLRVVDCLDFAADCPDRQCENHTSQESVPIEPIPSEEQGRERGKHSHNDCAVQQRGVTLEGFHVVRAVDFRSVQGFLVSHWFGPLVGSFNYTTALIFGQNI